VATLGRTQAAFKKLVACAAALASSACRSSAHPVGWDLAVDTLEGGIVHVVNTPLDEPPGWTLEETLRVGSVQGDGPTAFGGIQGFVVLDDGGFAILDGLAQEVRVFDADGAYRATYGGKGGGPGEFEGAYGLMRDPRGALLVPDYRNARMSVLDPRLGFQRSAPLRLLRRGFIWEGAVLEDGRVWKPSLTLGPPRQNVMRVYGPGLELVDSLPMPPDPDMDPEDPPGAFFWESADGTSRGYYGVPYYPQGESLIDPRGWIWSTAAGDVSYRITRWEPGGDTTLVLETRRAPVGIRTAERDSAIDVVRKGLQEVGGANQDWSKVPLTRPAVAGMFVSEEGELWVRTPLPDAEVFDVYDREGRHARTVGNPLHLYPWLRPYVRGDQLWCVVTDQLDVQYVVRARVVRADAS